MKLSFVNAVLLIQLTPGSAVSKIFKERMCDVLNAAYPSHKWYPWEFVNTDRKWWSDKTNQRAFVDYLRRKLNHSSLEDMYELSWTEIKKNKGNEAFHTKLHGPL